MTTLAERPIGSLPRLSPPTPTDIDDSLFTELCAELFASLPRSDQRAKGTTYVRGLLRAEGRKSIRKLASVSAGAVSEQGLHHFMCSSTWDWNPIRATLARWVVRTLPVQAWVVRPMVTPKAGEHSVGVDRGFSAEAGQMLNAQHAAGVWAAFDESCSPVNWRLHLTRTWLDDPVKRNCAAIPDDADVETSGSCAVAAYLEAMAFSGLPARPVVLDARSTDAPSIVRRLRAAGAPLFVRINAGQLLVPAHRVLPGRGAAPVAAQQIMAAVRDLRRPVYAPRPWPGGSSAGMLAAVVPVRLPDFGRGGRELALMGLWERGRGGPVAYWLTSLTTAGPATLVGLSRLMDRVDEDFERITDRMGIRDYAGRSYDGWHRHVTLVSAAHTIIALNSVGFTEGSYAS